MTFGRSKTFAVTAAFRSLAAGVILACLCAGAAAADAPPQHITSINNGMLGSDPKNPNVQTYGDAHNLGLGDTLGVTVDGSGSLDPTKYVLFLNEVAIDGLVARFDETNRTIVYALERNDKNTAAWKSLLGSLHGLGRHMTVALGLIPDAGSARPSIRGSDAANPPTFWFKAITTPYLIGGWVAIAATLALVWGGARGTNILKDNLIPQIDPARQTYSLARTQMAFWFTLIFASYVFLYVTLWDDNTLSTQALMLMGISSATALAAVAVDVAKDSPEDAVNAGLKALGIKSYTDIARIKAEIAQKTAMLRADPAPADDDAAKLRSDILDRQNLLRTYEAAIAGFVSENWYRDMVSDINGPALHRVQVLCWTALLGLIFVIAVWRNLAMPEFNGTLLALMGISGAGYVGFKYPEAQQ